jgi:hypothetical protein
MNSGTIPSASDLVGGLSPLASRLRTAPATGPLVALRERLMGELLGDTARALAALGTDFRLVTHVRGTMSTTDRAGVEANLRAMEGHDHLMWVELSDLVSDDEMVAGHGLLCSMIGRPPEADGAGGAEWVSVSKMPFAFFVRCDNALMTSETVFVMLEETEVRELEGSVASARAGLEAAAEGWTSGGLELS